MSEPQIVVNAIVRAKPGRADELEDELRAVAVTRNAEPGNVAFLVARANDDDHAFHLYEVYADPAGHAEHRRLTRLPDDPHKHRLAELVEGYTFVRGRLVSDLDQFSAGTTAQ